jgi:hypothetical protein
MECCEGGVGWHWDLPEKGFWRRMVNSPEGGGAIERGILMWLDLSLVVLVD